MIRADLHIHSCLSPCGSLDMSPSAIVHAARHAGLDMIAVTDHNSSRNSAVVARLAKQAGLACWHGLEACTVEEIHVVCLFPRLDEAIELSTYLRERLPPVPWVEGKMGDQVIVNEQEEIEEWETLFLGSGARITLTELGERVLAAGGWFIPAHVDRPVNSLLSQLGRVPDFPFSALEVSPAYDLAKDPERLADRFPLVGHSDAHHLEDIGRRWTLYAAVPVPGQPLRPAGVGVRPSPTLAPPPEEIGGCPSGPAR